MCLCLSQFIRTFRNFVMKSSKDFDSSWKVLNDLVSYHGFLTLLILDDLWCNLTEIFFHAFEFWHCLSFSGAPLSTHTMRLIKFYQSEREYERTRGRDTKAQRPISVRLTYQLFSTFARRSLMHILNFWILVSFCWLICFRHIVTHIFQKKKNMFYFCSHKIFKTWINKCFADWCL